MCSVHAASKWWRSLCTHLHLSASYDFNIGQQKIEVEKASNREVIIWISGYGDIGTTWRSKNHSNTSQKVLGASIFHNSQELWNDDPWSKNPHQWGCETPVFPAVASQPLYATIGSPARRRTSPDIWEPGAYVTAVGCSSHVLSISACNTRPRISTCQIKFEALSITMMNKSLCWTSVCRWAFHSSHASA